MEQGMFRPTVQLLEWLLLIFLLVLVQVIPPSIHKFKKRMTGSAGNERWHSCLHSWWTDFPWMHYDMALDLVFCYECTVAIKTGELN